MTITGRQKKIIDYLKIKRDCSINEIISLFDVTPATIRRDLTQLENIGSITRTYGEVHFIDQPITTSFLSRSKRFSTERNAIANVAASMIKANDTVLFDSGPITFSISEAVKNRTDITVVTNSLPVAFQAPSSHTTLVTGGMIDPETMSMIGPDAEVFLGNVSASVLFLETTGIRNYDGMTVISPFQAGIKRKMIECAKKRILVVNNDDLNASGAILFAPFSVLDAVIVASPLEDPLLQEHLERVGAKIIVAMNNDQTTEY